MLVRRPAGIEGEGGDAGKGGVIPAGVTESFVQGGARVSRQPLVPLVAQVRNGFPGAKKAADIDPVSLDGTKTDIPPRGQVHFQPVRER